MFTIQCVWDYRIVSNYEHNEGDFVPMKSILEEVCSEKDNENHSINESLVGVVIRSLWGDKVKKVCSSTKAGSGYRNIRKRPVSEGQADIIRTLNDETVQRLKASSSNHEGWVPDFSRKGQFSFVKVPFTQAGTTLDGRRLLYEISGYLDPSKISVRTYGQTVFIDELGNSLTFYALETIIRLLDLTTLCLGNLVFAGNDEEDVENLKRPVAGSIIVNVQTNQRKETRLVSRSCLTITSGTPACKNCAYVFKLWNNRESKRASKEGELHKKCNVRFLSRGGLEEKVSKQRKELRSDCMREKRAMNEMIEFSESDCADLMELIENVESKDVPEEMTFLWEMQRKQLASKSPAGYRWHPRIVRFALDVYCKSPKALDAMREFVILPSNRLIRYYKNSVSQNPGWNAEIIRWCQKEAERNNLKSADYWGGLVVDEMKIQEDLQMTVQGGKHQLVGMVSLGKVHQDMKRVETGMSAIQVATHLLQFIFLSDSGFRFPLAHFPTAQCPPSALYFQFWEGVLQMKPAGFSIYYCICDGGDANRQFIKIHFSNCSPVDLHFIGYNMWTGEPIVFEMDCKHNFKKIRNNIEKSSPSSSTTRCLTKDGKNIFWSHWKEAYLWDQRCNSSHCHERLKEDHFELTASSRMKNGLAEDVLDKRMLNLMKAYKEHLKLTNGNDDANRLNESIELLKHTSAMIDLFSDKHVIYNASDIRLQQLNDALHYFSDWKDQVQQAKDQFFSEKLWFDLQSMILGFCSIVQVKLSRFPGSVIKPAIMNQDLVENHFSQLRGANGQNENPTYVLTQATQNSVIFGQSTISQKGNTGTTRSSSFSALPKEHIFSKKSECN